MVGGGKMGTIPKEVLAIVGRKLPNLQPQIDKLAAATTPEEIRELEKRIANDYVGLGYSPALHWHMLAACIEGRPYGEIFPLPNPQLLKKLRQIVATYHLPERWVGDVNCVLEAVDYLIERPSYRTRNLVRTAWEKIDVAISDWGHWIITPPQVAAVYLLGAYCTYGGWGFADPFCGIHIGEFRRCVREHQ
jgi:hypothetical protein